MILPTLQPVRVDGTHTTLFSLGQTNLRILKLEILILATYKEHFQISCNWENHSLHYKHTCEQKQQSRDRSMSLPFTSSIELQSLVRNPIHHV